MNRTLELSLLGESFSSLRVLFAREEHQLMRPTRTYVRVVLDQDCDLDGMLGQAVRLETSDDASAKRYVCGIIQEVSLLAAPVKNSADRIAPTCDVVIVSRLGLLEQSVDCRIFQDLSTPDIIEQVLQDHGIPSDEFEWRLSSTYHPRIYCTQYKESALHFIVRLLEQEGINLACTSTQEGELFVFFDDSTQQAPQPEEALPARASSQQHAEGAAIYGLDSSLQTYSGKTSVNAFDFERPTLNLEQSVSAERFDDLEVYTVADHYVEPDRGKAFAQIRQEAELAHAHLQSLVTDCVPICLGQALKIDDGGEEAQYLVTAFVSEWNYQAISDNEDEGYQAGITAQVIRLEIPFRPKRTCLWPQIVGPQTATVTAPSGAQPEEVHTDEYGRIKVAFHWDRYHSQDDHASCWMRVAQMQTSGSMVLPRVNWEVVVEFVDGDPDRPMVTGRVYNGTFMPPYELPEGRTRTSLQTSSSPAGGGRNEIRFEDAAGAEEVMVHSQYNTAINAANDRVKNVTKDETLVVGNNAATTIGGNQTLAVTNGCKVCVGADQSTSVGGNSSTEVNAVYGKTINGNDSTSIGGNWTSMIGSPLDALIALGTAKAAELASAQAERTFAQVSGAAQGMVDQVLAPVSGLMEAGDGISANMAKVADGKMAAAGQVLGGAVALPTAGGMFQAMAKGPAVLRSAEGTDVSAGEIALSSAVGAAVSGSLTKAAAAITTAKLGEAVAQGGAAGGGSSAGNVGGPAGDLSGFSEEDTATGSGYSQFLIQGTHDETIGGSRIVAALESVNCSMKGSMTEDVGAAQIEVIAGDRAESVEGASTETEPALVVVAKGGEVEAVSTARQLNIGGALMEDVKGDYSLEAGATVSLTGATHEYKAKGKITIKCGASSIVVSGSGVTIQTPMLTVSGSGIAAKKAVSDG